jgi:hypothetical protein
MSALPANPPRIGTYKANDRTSCVAAPGELARTDRSAADDACPCGVVDCACDELAAWALAEARPARSSANAAELAAAYDRDVRADDAAEGARAERAWAFGRGV